MDLEAQFHEEMLAVYDNVGREIRYWAYRYLQRVRRVGGLQAAKEWLKPKSNPTQGLQQLSEKNRLDLSFEALVLREPWSTLFTDEELQVAHQRIMLCKQLSKEKKAEQLKYRVNIVWSEEDQAYLVELPEFTTEVQRYFTDGETYEEALKNAQEVLELLIESYQAEGRSLPTPQTLQAA